MEGETTSRGSKAPQGVAEKVMFKMVPLLVTSKGTGEQRNFTHSVAGGPGIPYSLQEAGLDRGRELPKKLTSSVHWLEINMKSSGPDVARSTIISPFAKGVHCP